MRAPKLRVHSFERNVIYPLPTEAVSGGFPMALGFNLTDLPNYSEFTALFDQYSIWRVDLSVLIGTSPLQLVSCVDYNDAALPASQAELLERGEAESLVLAAGNFQQFRRSVLPLASTEVFQGLTTAYAASKHGQWIDCETAAVPHFGYKFWFSLCAAGGSTANTSIVAKYHLRFRGEK
jgi:hypothetical protein